MIAHLMRSRVEVTSEDKSLAHVLVITVARVTNDPKYEAYSKGRKILSKVREK
jgi:hypothetical protein